MIATGWSQREVVRDRRIYWTRPGKPQLIQSTNKNTDLWIFLKDVARITDTPLLQVLFETLEGAVSFQMAGRGVGNLLESIQASPEAAPEERNQPVDALSRKVSLARKLAAMNYKRSTIAEMMGVSRQTVSKYLNGKPGSSRKRKLDDTFKTRALGLHQAGWKVAAIFKDLKKSGYTGSYQYLATFLKTKSRHASMDTAASTQERKKAELVKGFLLIRNLVFQFCNRAIEEVDPEFSDESLGKYLGLKAPERPDQLAVKN